jgi:hypothetical protein
MPSDRIPYLQDGTRPFEHTHRQCGGVQKRGRSSRSCFITEGGRIWDIDSKTGNSIDGYSSRSREWNGWHGIFWWLVLGVATCILLINRLQERMYINHQRKLFRSIERTLLVSTFSRYLSLSLTVSFTLRIHARQKISEVWSNILGIQMR